MQIKIFEKIYDRIYILPTAKIKGKTILAGKSNIIIKNYRVLRPNFFINYVLKIKLFINDLMNINNLNFTFKSLKRSFIVYGKSIFSYTFLNRLYSKEKLYKTNLTIYSFWFDDYSLGFCLLNKKYKNLSLISGAHGKDLFEERHVGNRIPFREKCLALIDKVFVCSHEGENYLTNKYPDYKEKVSLLSTGTYIKSIKTKPSIDGKFRILTLSRTHPIKRLKYLLNTLKEIEEYSDFDIEYFHIGGGRELHELKYYSESLSFSRFSINFLGMISEKEKKSFFEKHPIDVFLNVSLSEGTSVSVVEALSYSIPIILTKVGGNIRIGDFCKTLLNINFKSEELYSFFKKIYYDSVYRDKLKRLSVKYWSKNHDQKIMERKMRKLFSR